MQPTKLQENQAEVGEIKGSSFCLFNFTFPEEKVMVNYENDYISHYCCSGVLGFRVMADSFWKYNIGRKKYELWYIYVG
jgi:hypothetical protein